MSIKDKILNYLGMYISPEDEGKIKQALSDFWGAAKYDKSEYITYSDRDRIKKAIEQPVKIIKSIRVPKNNACYSEVKKAREYADTLDSILDDDNNEYIKRESIKADQLLSNIDGKSLDTQQRKVVVSDEDRTLVLAGAGSGKTLTIAGKVKYLCDIKGVIPENILLISFTQKSAQELTERINNKLGVNVEACTFHKLGLNIISRVNNAKPEIIDKLDTFIQDYLKNSLSAHSGRAADIVNFFAYYLTVPVDLANYQTAVDMYNDQKSYELESLKSRYNQEKWVKGKADYGKQKRISLKQEQLKSMEEVMLANFLFLHGVEYEYEVKYPYSVATAEYGVYHPDFYLPDYDIYIEHFGITEDYRLPWLDEEGEKKYLEGIEWKRKLHKENHTKLLETYSYMVSKGTFLNELENLLRVNGVKFNPPAFEDIFKVCYEDRNDIYMREFVSLCSSFITLFKSKGYGIGDLDGLFKKGKSGIFSMPWLSDRYIYDREKLFKKIITPIFQEYSDYLKSRGAIDFTDMINNATALVPRDKGVDKYEYIIIDEFQDISKARFNLIKAIIDKTGAKLLCVGDDWQSIYRFAGSDLSLFTDFEKNLGKSLILKIEKTYRNSQQLIDVAEHFVMKNPRQMKKQLSSDKSLAIPVKLMLYSYTPKQEIRAIMDAIIKDNPAKSIMILGRISYDEHILEESGLFGVGRGGRLIYKSSPDTPIQFCTVHKSKGLEADNVIIINFKNALLGFPNKISDDPVLEKVLDVPDAYMYAEERRLFYVALTRTRNNVYILVEQQKPSEFFQELKNYPSVKVYTSAKAGGDTARFCPKCKTGVLVVRRNSKDGHNFMGCSNYPQCDYTYHKVEKSYGVICPNCGVAMVRRKGKYGEFYGCSNYPKCKYIKKLEDV